MLGIRPEKDWVDVLGALGPFVIGLAVAYIAWKQYQTTEKQRKQKAQEVCFDVYKLVKLGLQNVFREGDVSYETRLKFFEAMEMANLFLNEEVAKFTQEIFEISDTAFLESVLLKDTPRGEKREGMVKEKYDAITKLTKIEPLGFFKKHLKID